MIPRLVLNFWTQTIILPQPHKYQELQKCTTTLVLCVRVSDWISLGGSGLPSTCLAQNLPPHLNFMVVFICSSLRIGDS